MRENRLLIKDILQWATFFAVVLLTLSGVEWVLDSQATEPISKPPTVTIRVDGNRVVGLKADDGIEVTVLTTDGDVRSHDGSEFLSQQTFIWGKCPEPLGEVPELKNKTGGKN